MLSFKPSFLSFSFNLINRFFSSVYFLPLVVSFAFLRLLIYLPTILIPVCNSSKFVLHMMYSAYKLNKQGDNIQTCLTLFPIFEPVHYSMFSSNCCFWPVYRFLRKQVRWSGIPLSLRIFHCLSCRWYHFNGRNWSETKQPLDEGERGEWKWLKTQHSKTIDHGIVSHHIMANRWVKMELVTDLTF